MRDKILIRAIIISIAVHVAAVSFIGRSSSMRLSSASAAPVAQRLLNVNLVKDPLAEAPQPKPTPVEAVKQVPLTSQPTSNPMANNTNRSFGGNSSTAPTPTPAHPTRVASNAGGALNTGTPSKGGDLPGMNSGRTPVGWVPGNDSGRGQGSGSGSGVGTPEPPRPDPPRHVEPAPPPPPPPPVPKRTTVRVCDVSGQLAGQHCKGSRNESFNEGNEPRRTCDRCKAPEREHVNRLADQAKPTIARDVRPRVPDSLDEGLSLEVEIEYSVDADGGVSGVRVAQSSGNRELDRAVMAAASQWRYNPAVQDGVPRKVKVTRTIRVKT